MSSPIVKTFHPGIDSGGISIEEIRLAAGGGEGRSDVVRFALRALQAHEQHVLGEPALIARLPAGNAQRVALLPPTDIAAVARTDALDGELLREVHDEAPLGVQIPRGVQPTHEHPVGGDALDAARPMRVMIAMLSTT